MKRGFKVITGFFAVVPLIVASCMTDSSSDIPDFNEQLQQDIAAIDNYLTAHNVANVIEHTSGIRYVMHFDSVGGVEPTVDSCVTANYKGLNDERTAVRRGDQYLFSIARCD